LGTEISKVRSVTLDDWKPEWIATAHQVGNARANAFYEHAVPAGERFLGQVELSGGDTLDPSQSKGLEQWIRAKYQERRYAPKDTRPPSEDVALQISQAPEPLRPSKATSSANPWASAGIQTTKEPWSDAPALSDSGRWALAGAEDWSKNQWPSSKPQDAAVADVSGWQVKSWSRGPEEKATTADDASPTDGKFCFNFLEPMLAGLRPARRSKEYRPLLEQRS